MFIHIKMKISKFLNMKNSFSIFELILTLVISSIIIIFSSQYIKEIFLENQNVQTIEKAKIDLRSTKIFIEKNIQNIDKISFSNGNLYFENSKLLNQIKDFKIVKNSKNIEIHINYDDKIVQTWEFLL